MADNFRQMIICKKMEIVIYRLYHSYVFLMNFQVKMSPMKTMLG